MAENGFENRIHRIGADSIVKIVIDHQGRGVVTVAQANNWQQGEFSVLRGISIFDAQTIAQTVADTLVPAHPTRHAVTHLYDMIANGISKQKVVEGIAEIVRDQKGSAKDRNDLVKQGKAIEKSHRTLGGDLTKNVQDMKDGISTTVDGMINETFGPLGGIVSTFTTGFFKRGKENNQKGYRIFSREHRFFI